MLLAPRKLLAVGILLFVLVNAQPVLDSKKEAEDKGGLMLGKIWNESLLGKTEEVKTTVASTTDATNPTTASSVKTEAVFMGVSGNSEDTSGGSKESGKAKAHLEYEVTGLGENEEKKVAQIEQLFGKINNYLVCTYENKDDCDKQLVDKTSSTKETKKQEKEKSSPEKKTRRMRRTGKETKKSAVSKPWWATNYNRQPLHRRSRYNAFQSSKLPQALKDEPLAGSHHFHPKSFMSGPQPVVNTYFHRPNPYYPSVPRPMYFPYYQSPEQHRDYYDSFTPPEPQLSQVELDFYDRSRHVPMNQVDWARPAYRLPQSVEYTPKRENYLNDQGADYWPSSQSDYNYHKQPFNNRRRTFPATNFRGFRRHDKVEEKNKEEKQVGIERKQQGMKKQRMNRFEKNHEESKPFEQFRFEGKREWPSKSGKTRFNDERVKEKRNPAVKRGYITTFSRNWDFDEDDDQDEEKKQQGSKPEKKSDFNDFKDDLKSIDDAWKDWEGERDENPEYHRPFSNSKRIDSGRKHRSRPINWQNNYERPASYMQQTPHEQIYGPQSSFQNPWFPQW